MISLKVRSFLFLLFGLICGCNPVNKEHPLAKNGLIDLRDYNFSNGIIELRGEWEFYWQQLLDPHAFRSQQFQPANFDVPASWNGYNHQGETLGGNGYATFRLTVLLPDSPKLLGIKFLTAGTAYSLWVNGNLILKNGTVGKTRETSVANDKPQTLAFQPESRRLELVQHISNFHHRKGGFWESIELGTHEDIFYKQRLMNAFDLFLFGSLFIIGFYHLGLYLLRRNVPSALYLGLFCLLIGIRVLFTGENFFRMVFPDLSYEISTKIEYLTYYLCIPLFLKFLSLLFPKEISRGVLSYILIICFLFSVSVLVLPSYLYTHTLISYQIITVVLGIYAFWMLSTATAKKRDGAYILFWSYFFLFFSAINDMLYSDEVIRSVYLGPFGLFLFILGQSFVLSMRFSHAFSTIEVMTDELKKKNKVLSEIDQMKDEFLANTSHELRTPLHGIIGLAESLNDGVTGALSEATKHNLSMIISSGKRLLSLVNDILDFSKLKNRDLDLDLKNVDIHALTDMVIMLLKPLTMYNDIQLNNLISEKSPLVRADENRLQQILYNLIGNAIKFTEYGSVTVSSQQKNGTLHICIKDTGCGIPEEKHGRIFESFEQSEGSSARTHGGTGLGLAITKKLVEIHGGEIWFTSELDTGSTFCFSLPFAAGETEPEPLQISERFQKLDYRAPHSDVLQLQTTRMGINSRFRILVVDDEVVNRQVLMNHLSLENYEIIEVANGEEALEAIESNAPFDLILLDVMMPKMSGFEVCDLLRERFSLHELPIIFLTAKNQITDIAFGFETGGNDYLTKPVSKEELLTRVRTHLQLLDINRNLEQKVAERTQQLNEQNEELDTLDRIVRLINQEMMFDRVLKSILEQGLKLFTQAQRATFLLRDRNKNTYTFRAASGYELEELEPVIFQSDEILQRYTQKAHQIKENCYIVNDFESLTGSEKLKHLPTPKSILSMVILVENETQALLIFDNMDDKDAFNLSDVNKLTRFYDHILNAFSKANILNELNVKNGVLESQNTELNQANKTIQDQIKKLVELDKAKDNILSVVAHDLRSPLGIISGFQSLILTTEEETINDNVKECLSHIGNACTTMNTLINDLLDVTKLESDNFQLELFPLNLTEYLMAHDWDFRALAQKKRIEVELHLPEYPVDIRGNMVRLNQMLTNLITNAIKFTDEGGNIDIHLTADSHWAEIKVADNGIGIPEHQLDHIFQRFTKASREGTKGEASTGIGMSIVKRLVELHNGTISVQSKVEFGTSFMVRLPIKI